MNPSQRVIDELKTTGFSKKKEFGNSMMPLIKSGSTMTYQKQDEYEIDDIVFAKVKSFYTHKITGKRNVNGKIQYQISNNKGNVNGWTFNVYGKVINIEPPK